MKKFMLLLTAIAVLICLCAPIASAAQTPKIGGVADYALYTDIVTYINGAAIPSYNIKGNTAVVVEELLKYGFGVVWNARQRSLSVAYTGAAAASDYVPGKISPSQIGKRAKPVLYTDIECFLDGYRYTSYNIGGQTVVYVDDLARVFGSGYVWSQSERTLRLDTARAKTFEERIDELVSADSGMSGVNFQVNERYDCGAYTVIYGSVTGAPHGASYLWIVYRNGQRRDVFYYLPQWTFSDYYISQMALSADETTLTFTRKYQGQNRYYAVDLPTAYLYEA
jgi:hypothetical protein